MIKIHEIIHKIYQFYEDSQSLDTLSDGSIEYPGLDPLKTCLVFCMNFERLVWLVAPR